MVKLMHQTQQAPLPKADVCLILEGTYPYVSGGVSSWVHDVISAQPDLTFEILSLNSPTADLTHHYEVPANVRKIHNVFLQELPHGASSLPKKEAERLFRELEAPLLNLQSAPDLRFLQKTLDILHSSKTPLGAEILLNSKDAWNMLLRMYRATMGKTCFLDYFWSWRVLMGGLFSVLLCKIPRAHIYHSACTGYAGALLARAHLETDSPCILTEHGIYTNERCIEIADAEWLNDDKSINFNVQKTLDEKSLREFWVDAFTSYSQLCYDACDYITTLFEGNRDLQIADGADTKKLMTIANGIDLERYGRIKRDEKHPPTIALIGRVVPIKDIKTFIRVCNIVRRKIPDLQAYVIGPKNEDPEYYEECMDMIKFMKLEKTITFTGKVDITEYLGKIDLLLLTSISEGQPLVLLEAGAAGIPSITTDVGCCREIIEGRSDEEPKLGHGGVVTPLVDPSAMANAVVSMFEHEGQYKSYAATIKERVKQYYNKTTMHASYRGLYDELIHKSKKEEE